MNFNTKLLRNKIFKSYLYVTIILFVSFSNSFGQDTINKKRPLININYFNINNDSFFVQLSSNYKDKKFFPIENQVIKLFLNEVEDANYLGAAITDMKGEGIINLPAKFKDMIKALSSFDLTAETDEGIKYKAGSGSATIENIILDIQTEVVDNADITKIIRVSAYSTDEQGKKPLADAEVEFFIKRLVGLFPLPESVLVTDSTGMAKMEYIINDMPGDSLGTLIVGARLTDTDTYGNTMSLKETLWGIKKTYIDFESIRALWARSNRVPIWLLFLSCGIIFVIWTTILYVMFQVYKIYKLGQKVS